MEGLGSSSRAFVTNGGSTTFGLVVEGRLIQWSWVTTEVCFSCEASRDAAQTKDHTASVFLAIQPAPRVSTRRPAASLVLDNRPASQPPASHQGGASHRLCIERKVPTTTRYISTPSEECPHVAIETGLHPPVGRQDNASWRPLCALYPKPRWTAIIARQTDKQRRGRHVVGPALPRRVVK